MYTITMFTDTSVDDANTDSFCDYSDWDKNSPFPVLGRQCDGIRKNAGEDQSLNYTLNKDQLKIGYDIYKRQ